jgi:hypothetical protein
MYTRDSRYRQVSEVSRRDPSERTLLVTDFRTGRSAEGTFRHTVDTNDRLDQLAQQYYGKPRKWWLIGDANPEFASPLALLGHDPIRGVQLVMEGPVADRPWWRLLSSLRALPGVEDVRFEVEPQVLGGVVVDSAVLTVRFNEATVTVGAITDTVTGAGFDTAGQQTLERAGKRITIPPEGLA